MCEDDYGVQEEDAFQWTEWELISLESAEGDNEWKSVIIVQGSAPELEECEMAADSFREFVKKIISKEIIL